MTVLSPDCNPVGVSALSKRSYEHEKVNCVCIGSNEGNKEACAHSRGFGANPTSGARAARVAIRGKSKVGLPNLYGRRGTSSETANRCWRFSLPFAICQAQTIVN